MNFILAFFSNWANRLFLQEEIHRGAVAVNEKQHFTRCLEVGLGELLRVLQRPAVDL